MYASPELELGVDEIERLTGVRPRYGGRHLGLGTHNALVSLGPKTYLEVIAPDPSQDGIGEDLPFGFGSLSHPALRAWAVAPSDLSESARAARAAGAAVGDVVAHSRGSPDGGEVRWRMTTRPTTAGDKDRLEVVPFLIDWGESVHPASSAPGGVRLARLRVVTTDAAGVRRRLQAIGVGAEVEVQAGAEPALEAVVVGPSGREVVLRS